MSIDIYVNDIKYCIQSGESGLVDFLVSHKQSIEEQISINCDFPNEIVSAVLGEIIPDSTEDYNKNLDQINKFYEYMQLDYKKYDSLRKCSCCNEYYDELLFICDDCNKTYCKSCSENYTFLDKYDEPVYTIYCCSYDCMIDLIPTSIHVNDELGLTKVEDCCNKYLVVYWCECRDELEYYSNNYVSMLISFNQGHAEPLFAIIDYAT